MVVDMIYQKPKLIMALLLPIELNACRAMIVHADCPQNATTPSTSTQSHAPFSTFTLRLN